MIDGVVIKTLSYLTPQKTVKYKCKNCDFEEKYIKNKEK